MPERKRVCGIRCRNAKGKRCRCVCEGATHGSAYHQAPDQTPVVRITSEDGQSAIATGANKPLAIQERLPLEVA